MKHVRPVCNLVGLALYLAVSPLSAQSVPMALNYQGRLLQNTGDQAAVTGTADIIFSIWSGPASDGSAALLWSETWADVAFSNGIFSVLLGSNGSPLEPADFQGDSSLFLQLEIDGEVLLPRQQLGSTPFAIVDEPANELQDLELSGDTLGLTGSATTVDLSPYLDDSDSQDLSLSGTSLSLTGDATPVDLTPFLDDTDEQTLSLAGDTLAISGSGSSVDLSGYLDDTDAQTLSLAGATLGISGSGSSVDLSSFLDNTDAQSLALVGTNLGISGSGSSVDLSVFLDNTDIQTLALTGDSLTVSGSGSSVDLSSAATVTDLVARVDEAESDLRRTVFVTSQTYSGALGGLGGADAECQALADAAGLDGTFLAWLADSSRSPSTRFVRDSRDYVLVDGTTVADGWTDLTDGTIQNPIDVTETGATLGGSLGVWTASTASGTGVPGHCDDWTTDTSPPVGRIGFTDAVDGTWTDSFNDFGCNGTFRLYCFEQSSASGIDDQVLALAGTDLQLTSDDGPDVVSLAGFLDDTDEQTLSLTGNTLAISGSGSTVDLSPYLDDSDAQDLSLAGTTLSLTGDATPVDLATFLDDTDEQTLSLTGNTLAISGSGSSVDLSPYLDDSDAQDLSLAGTTLSLTGDATPVDLAGFLDDTDEQTLSLTGNTLAISGTGSSVDLSGYLDDTDAQSLSHVLSIGNSAGNVTISDLGAPAAASDAATKGYVDSAVSGGAGGFVELAPAATQEATTTNDLVDLKLLGTTNLGVSGTSDLLSLGASGDYYNHWFGTTVSRDRELFRVDNAGGILAVGEFGHGLLPATGAGTRLMWIPRWAAFRAGHVEGTQWDDFELGLYSAAFGFNSRASGDYSLAAGYNTWARDNAFAMGRWAKATGENSVALGHGAHANSRKGAFIFADDFYDFYCEAGSLSDDPSCGATEDNAFRATINNSFNVRATGGVYLWSDAAKTRGLTFRTFQGSLTFDNSAINILSTGETRITSNSAGTTGVSLAAGGGSWTMLSDRNVKENFLAVDGEDLLRRLRVVPVTTWNYQAQDRLIRHMGPMAQDFHAAFALGGSDTGITTVDLGGVALGGVKALDARTTEQQERIATLEDELRQVQAENDSLTRRLERLEALLIDPSATAADESR